MWIVIVGIAFIAVVLLILIIALAQKRKRAKAKRKEESVINGIAVGICDRLHAAYSHAKWRWVCRPAGFAVNGGIARIEVMYPSGKQQFMDVCFAANGYMALHVLDAYELKAPDVEPIPAEIPAPAPTTGAKPCDKEGVIKWYNIVLKNALFAVIDDLNAMDGACVNIGQDGKAFVEENGGISVVYEFGEMPDMSLWGHITEKLCEEGLFAEVQEGNCIFISWA